MFSAAPRSTLTLKHHLVKSRSSVTLRVESYSKLREKVLVFTRNFISHWCFQDILQQKSIFIWTVVSSKIKEEKWNDGPILTHSDAQQIKRVARAREQKFDHTKCKLIRKWSEEEEAVSNHWNRVNTLSWTERSHGLQLQVNTTVCDSNRLLLNIYTSQTYY